MSNQKVQLRTGAPIQSESHAPLATENAVVDLSSQNVKPEPKGPSVPEKKPDVWESLSVAEKVSFITIIGLILGLVIYANVGEKTAEFYITTFFTITVVLIALSQYHISKRQWLAMERQLNVIDEQADLMYHQLTAMQDALGRTDTLIEQSERHFRMTERPVVYVDEVFGDVQEDQPLKPHLQISNRGRGVAVDMTWWVAFSPGPHTFEAETAFGGNIDVLAPGANPLDIWVNLEGDDWIITKDLYREIADPQNHRYIYIYYGGSYWDSDKQTQFVLEECAWRWTSNKGFLKDAFAIPFARTLRASLDGKTPTHSEKPN